MIDLVRHHYETHPYPHYPLAATVRRPDTYALNLTALWGHFNGRLPSAEERTILIAGCGSFSPYPFGLANPDCRITALDLSQANLKRARLHCLLHGITGIDFQQGDLLALRPNGSTYGMIDAYGVIHHLADPAAGLRALANQLCDGGILRLMVYSRYARREEEAIRHAFRLLNIRDVTTAKRLLEQARPGSRLHRFIRASDEIRHDTGLADALLHPRVTTYRIGELMELVGASGLTPLRFAHWGALDDSEREIERLTGREQQKESPGNFVLYLGKNPAGTCTGDGSVMLNPCLTPAVSRFRLRPVEIAPRLGHTNPPLDINERRFLRRFVQPQPMASLSENEVKKVAEYELQLFLVYSHCTLHTLKAQ